MLPQIMRNETEHRGRGLEQQRRQLAGLYRSDESRGPSLVAILNDGGLFARRVGAKQEKEIGSSTHLLRTTQSRSSRVSYAAGDAVGMSFGTA